MRSMPLQAAAYDIIDETYSDQDDTYASYGIVAYTAENQPLPTVVAMVHHITFNRKRLSQLVSLCNQGQLSLLHLEDVIDDFLSGY